MLTAPTQGVGAQEPAGDAADRTGTRSAVEAYSEDEVKAAFLFHFATYAEWPGQAGENEITFAVMGAPPIADALERFAADRRIASRPVRVRRIRSLTELDEAEVLFIGSSHNRRLEQLVTDVEGPTLVVTDAPNGLPDGAMINFQVIDRRVRFEVALPAVQRVGLSLSSRLLSAALRVEMTRCYLECRRIELDTLRYADIRWFRTPSPA